MHTRTQELCGIGLTLPSFGVCVCKQIDIHLFSLLTDSVPEISPNLIAILLHFCPNQVFFVVVSASSIIKQSLIFLTTSGPSTAVSSFACWP